MDLDFQKLQTILLLGALVPVFAFLYRSNRSDRVRMWVIAWVLVLVRVILQAFGGRMGMSPPLLNALDLGGFQLSGVVLLVSMTRIFQDKRQQLPFFLMLAVPSVTYAVLFAVGYSNVWLFAAITSVMGLGAFAWVLAYHRRKIERYMLAICATVLLFTLWGAFRAIQGRIDLGFYSIQTVTYALAGFLYWYSYKRFSPGIVLSSIGFFAWAAILPAVHLVDPKYPRAAQVLIALANLPRFWVAIGMIVTLLEDRSGAAQLAEAQERATREQIQRFFQVTSRLLSGADVASLCDEIAAIVTESSNFQRAVILLSDDQRKLYVAGASGIDAAGRAVLLEEVHRLNVDIVAERCGAGIRLGHHSCRLSREQVKDICLLPTTVAYPSNPFWEDGDKIVVLFRSPSGALMGCMSLDEPRNVQRVNAEELAAVEMLSADIAISMENTRLQRQLLLSEKLAGLGKLVAGAGHELNNPLTAVLGYSEMLGASLQDEGSRRGVEVIRREALRMKEIIENLLRFARQTKFERQAVSLSAIVDEVLRLQTYELKRAGVGVSLQIDPNLPGVMVDEGLLRQVFLNVVNNSMEALQRLPNARISIDAARHGDRIQMHFCDNGPGFSDLDRVFDPFFTTKSPGQGPGLGLSVSYGIIKQHGGEISAYNLHPSGACVLIELPIAADASSLLETSDALEA